MARGDILLVEPKNVSTQTFQVAAGAANSISPGEPVVRTSGTATVALAADATPTSDTDEFVGLAATESTDTAAAAGTVDVYVFTGGEVISAAAKTAGNADTLTEIRALANDNLLFDLTSGTWTVDTTSASALNGLTATGEGEPENSRVYLRVKTRCTMVGSKL